MILQREKDHHKRCLTVIQMIEDEHEVLKIAEENLETARKVYSTELRKKAEHDIDIANRVIERLTKFYETL